MANWQVRHEGAPSAVTLPSANDILAGLRDGIWLPTDEVRGPGDAKWQAIEAHPTFAEATDEMEHPPAEPPDETHLDMNPLIDVCLVLLIFFILTITVESLRRSIDLPSDNSDDKGAKVLKKEDIQNKVFRVTARMDAENKVVLKVEEKTVPAEQVYDEIKSVIAKTGLKQMYLDVDGNVPWGVQTAILDAAKGNNVQEILYRPKPRR
jgi:biopolymer transport protein ExbD